MSSIPVFYIPFGVYYLESEYDYTELKKDKRFTEGHSEVINNSGIRHKYSHCTNILNDYPNLAKKILDLFHTYMREVGITTNFSLTTSWLVEVNKGDFIHTHKHKNCEFSGVLYYDDDYTDQAPLEFANPLFDLTSFHDTNARYNGYTHDWQLPPEKNLIVFFPSYINHYGNRNTTDKPRRSLAFNLAPSGKYGAGDSTMDTRWLNS